MERRGVDAPAPLALGLDAKRFAAALVDDLGAAVDLDPARPRLVLALVVVDDQGDAAVPSGDVAVLECSLEAVGEDIEREGLWETPERVARMYDEILVGHTVDPEVLLNEALFDVEYNQMVVVSSEGPDDGEHHDHTTAEQAALIRESRIFFVASAGPELGDGPSGQGPVNLSPKGGVPLHVIDERRVAYLDYRGSGNETARHTAAGGPVTLMVMAMGDGDAAIVRLYGHARVLPLGGTDLADRVAAEPAPDLQLPERQVIEVDVERTQTSCGYGVPVFEYRAERVRAQRGRRFKEPARRL